MPDTQPVTTKQQPEQVPFELYPHDVRVERGDDIYYVRGVRRWESYRASSGGPDFNIVSIALWLTMVAAGGVLRRHSKSWKVGVLSCRRGAIGGRIRLVYKERLAMSQNPVNRIAELVQDVDEGRFDR